MTDQNTPLKTKVTLLPKGLTEKIAEKVHEQWSIWQLRQDFRKIQNNAGTVEFADGTWQDWNRKACKSFKELTPEEQHSDIDIAKKIWLPFLVEVLSAERKSQEAEIQQLKDQLKDITAVELKLGELEKQIENTKTGKTET